MLLCMSWLPTRMKIKLKMNALEWLKHYSYILDAQAVILLPAHPASFAHNFVSGMQSFYFSESQDAIVLQICH